PTPPLSINSSLPRRPNLAAPTRPDATPLPSPNPQIAPKTLAAAAMAASPTASASGSAAAAAAAASEANDGPTLSVVTKRLRALRKKQNRIAQMEEAVAAGKTLNQEQKEVMRSKPTLAAVIDELERLRAPLAVAVAEEVSVAPAPAPAPAPEPSGSDSSVQDLLALVYFGALFDVKPQSDFIATMVAREHERSSCITYDCVGDDTVDLLVEGATSTSCPLWPPLLRLALLPRWASPTATRSRPVPTMPAYGSPALTSPSTLAPLLLMLR
uniref:Uncharacterized protein n=2 Tax=Aegilops tauschii subsp. strangulata TaxID=200361 RepID=A0A453H3A9_AEGTS